MRSFVFMLSFCLLTITLSAQSHTPIFRFGKMKISQDQNSGFYQIRKKKKIIKDSLLNIKRLDSKTIELITADLKIYCLDKQGEKVLYRYPPNPSRKRKVFCGNALMGIKDPHIWIEPYGDSIFVYMQNGCSPQNLVLYGCSFEEADRLQFVNGKTAYFLDTEFNIPKTLEHDLQLVFIKDGKKGLVGVDKEATKDHLYYREGYLWFEEQGLCGYLGINEQGRYKRLGDFRNGYARFELEDGRKGLLDPKGNEFIARK